MTQGSKIKEIFEQISEKENHEFKINEQYVNKTPFEIETMNGYVPVVSMMIKTDTAVTIVTESGVEILASLNHKISTPEKGVVFVSDLKVGDKLSNKNGSKTITDILIGDEVTVYDLAIDSDDHLYLDSNGFIHHNTFHITEGPRSLPAMLGAEGNKWTYHSGTKASPLSFYKTLFQERDKIIVFDEADAVLKHSEIVMMLKPILDTSGKNLAEYITGTQNMVGKSDSEIEEYAQWVDEEIADGKIVAKKNGDLTVALPSKFKFTGGMIFISNMKSSEIEQAIMSRSIFVDVYLAAQDVIKRIETIGAAMVKGGKATEEDIDEVLEALGKDPNAPIHDITYMTPEYARKSKQVTVRAMQLALMMKKSGLKRWKHLAALYA